MRGARSKALRREARVAWMAAPQAKREANPGFLRFYHRKLKRWWKLGRLSTGRASLYLKPRGLRKKVAHAY